jgi:hypothetical protein
MSHKDTKNTKKNRCKLSAFVENYYTLFISCPLVI